MQTFLDIRELSAGRATTTADVATCSSFGLRIVLDRLASLVESGDFDEADGGVLAAAVVVLDGWRVQPSAWFTEASC